MPAPRPLKFAQHGCGRRGGPRKVPTASSYSRREADALTTMPLHRGSGPIWGFDSLTCKGNEASLGDCKFPGFGSSLCSHDYDVPLRCANATGWGAANAGGPAAPLLGTICAGDTVFYCPKLSGSLWLSGARSC